jgi:TPR repeat protein
MYEEGLAVDADPHKARGLYERSAQRGEFFACIWLARLLASGKCGGVDESGALRWYSQALSDGKVSDCAEVREAQAYVDAHDK